MGILGEAVRLWYTGLGQAFVGATCPFIAGPLLWSVLYFAPEWVPVLQQMIAALKRARATLVSIMWISRLGAQRAILFLRRVLIRILLGREQIYRDLEMAWLKEAEIARGPRCGGELVERSGPDLRWERPIRLWRRISLAFPYFWVLVAGLCAFISILYIISLGNIRYQEGHPPDVSSLYLSLWMVAGGLFLTFCNVLSVLAIPLTALRVKGLWMDARQRWVGQQQEKRHQLVKRSRVYDTGAMIPDRASWRGPNLVAVNEALSKAWQNGLLWRRSQWHELWQAVRLYLFPQRIKPPAGSFYLLSRERGRWVVKVPKGKGGRAVQIKLRRPAIQRIETLSQGHRKVLQEGDIITFEDEQWYLLIERLYPE